MTQGLKEKGQGSVGIVNFEQKSLTKLLQDYLGARRMDKWYIRLWLKYLLYGAEERVNRMLRAMTQVPNPMPAPIQKKGAWTGEIHPVPFIGQE